MRIIWYEIAWADYLSWQLEDKKMLHKINTLVKDIARNAYDGIGKPEPLKGNLSGYWSRRIDQTHRLVYRVCGDQNEFLEIVSCKGHYNS